MIDTETRFWTKVDRRFAVGACWEWLGSMSGGYGQIQFQGKVERAHRVSYLLFVGPIADGLWVLHQCDNKKCVRPDHLRLGTREENAREAVERGRMATGDRNAARLYPERVRRGVDQTNSKLTDDDVRAIRKRYSDGETQAALSKEYGIQASHISLIVTRRAWRHVD